MSMTIGRSEDILWNNYSYTSVISLKQYISKDAKETELSNRFFYQFISYSTNYSSF